MSQLYAVMKGSENLNNPYFTVFKNYPKGDPPGLGLEALERRVAINDKPLFYEVTLCDRDREFEFNNSYYECKAQRQYPLQAVCVEEKAVFLIYELPSYYIGIFDSKGEPLHTLVSHSQREDSIEGRIKLRLEIKTTQYKQKQNPNEIVIEDPQRVALIVQIMSGIDNISILYPYYQKYPISKPHFIVEDEAQHRIFTRTPP